LQHSDVILEHLNVVLVVGRFIPHFLLILGDHLVISPLGPVTFLVEAQLKPLLLGLIEVA
jgi:hypothetical protein